MYILNIAKAKEKMSVNEIKDFTCENYYKRIGFSKENTETFKENRFIVAWKQINKKVPDPRNAKEHYQSFLRKKNTNSVKKLKIVTHQPKTSEDPNFT